MFASISEPGVDLLKKMLVFNPYLRPSIDQCLAHPYFDGIREPVRENPCPKKVVMEFDRPDATMADLRQEFIKVLNQFEHFKVINQSPIVSKINVPAGTSLPSSSFFSGKSWTLKSTLDQSLP